MENSQNLCLKSLLPFPLLWGLRNFLLETRVTDELMWRQRPQTPPPKVLTSTFTQVKGNQRQDVCRTSQDPSAAASPTTPTPVLAAHRLFVFTSGAASQVISNRGFKSKRTDSSSEYDIQKNLGGIQTRRLLAESIKTLVHWTAKKKPLLFETPLALHAVWRVHEWLPPEFTQLSCRENQGEGAAREVQN